MKPRRPTEDRVVGRVRRNDARTEVKALFGFQPRRAQIEWWLQNPKSIESLKVVLGVS